MLTKKTDGSGEYLLRAKYDPRAFSVSPRRLEEISSWARTLPFEELLTERGSPFESTFTVDADFERDGRRWVRFVHPVHEYCFELEIKPDGLIGEIVALPPEEAWRLALERDRKEATRVVLEDD